MIELTGMVSATLNRVLKDHSIVQLVLKFGANQEIKEDTQVVPWLDHLELIHASKGRTIIMYDSILFINTVPKGQEPQSWRRDDEHLYR